ncbi:Vacuolar iron transporter 1, partial [Linum grandiflorum]
HPIRNPLRATIYTEQIHALKITIATFQHHTEPNSTLPCNKMATQQPATASLEPEKQTLLNHHKEKHFTAGEVVRDIIIGVSDGLTVPFALAAGLSGANAPSSIVLTAGLAEVAAGSISMGLGGYLAARSEADHYSRELKREQEEIIAVPDTEAAEVAEILADYGVQPHEYAPVVNALRKNPQAWLDFMMKVSGVGTQLIPYPNKDLQNLL